jgi:hypothetical protein
MAHRDLEILCTHIEFSTSEYIHAVVDQSGQQIAGVFASIEKDCLLLDGSDISRKEFFLHARHKRSIYTNPKYANTIGVYVCLVESRDLFSERGPERVNLVPLGVAILTFDEADMGLVRLLSGGDGPLGPT